MKSKNTSSQIKSSKWIYHFGGDTTEGNAQMRDLLGGKGANLAEMATLGLPVPPGFTITTEVCTYYYAHSQSYPPGLKAAVETAIEWLGKQQSKQFGDPSAPLLLSVRSGAPVSMPGMMDTILNLGLNDTTVEGLARLTSNPRFAYDNYRRFIQMYGNVVMGIPIEYFEKALDNAKQASRASTDAELPAEVLLQLVNHYQSIFESETGQPFPQDVFEQLWGAIGAVFRSWMTPRAVTYRKIHNLSDDMGTAVNVQAMVFGNMGDDSATGVAFSRNPATGEKAIYGEYLRNAQGEDIVAGIRTPQPLTRAMAQTAEHPSTSLEELMPQVAHELFAMLQQLERHYRDMQDIEFTIEKGRLYILQTRNGKRTPRAAVKIAVDMAEEGLIRQEEAVLRIEPELLDRLLHPTIASEAPRHVIAQGLPASPGAAVGHVVFSPEEAERRHAAGEKVILVRHETSPEDIHGMHVAEGILTARGGMTSHAAVVARGMGKPCITGAGTLNISYANRQMSTGGVIIQEGDLITLDGTTGEVMMGALPMVNPHLSGELDTLLQWADDFRRMRIRANAETPPDAQQAVEFGAEGIGLCRTEHMFFDGDRIAAMREMIVADTPEERQRALAKLLPMQRNDFIELFQIMNGRPITIRFLDPPLHEFLPHTNEAIESVSHALGISADRLRDRIRELQEANPMLGLRGCRLGILYPEIYHMQAKAVFEAAVEVKRATGITPRPEIMIPLAASAQELHQIRQIVEAAAIEVSKQLGETVDYLYGTMIEIPRAALTADEIAKGTDFFSFGTNDLTQMTFGLSRDDSGKFLPHYYEKGILPTDPFQHIDREGVGQLVHHAAQAGRSARADLHLGVCGEHGGDPESINFFEEVGLDYVSCSPFRVPIARLAAAQATLRQQFRS